MTVVFVVCAAAGATVLVLQFLLALAGLGGDALGVDVPHDFGHDLCGGDHDFGADGGDHDLTPGEAHGDVAHDSSADGDHADTIAQVDHSAGSQVFHGSTWLFHVLSLRTIVAGLAFFGLAGLAADAAKCAPLATLLIAATAGSAAVYAVYAMLRGLPSLQAEGTARIQQAVGELASVYLRIPAQEKGAGKIQINLQNRTVECLATTPGDAIPSGATVVVIKVLGPDTVQVEAVRNVPITKEPPCSTRR